MFCAGSAIQRVLEWERVWPQSQQLNDAGNPELISPAIAAMMLSS
jgi:hypothetical protein